MSNANLPELMLLYLADALTDEEHAVVKERLSAGDTRAVEALRDARELYAALPVALDPIEPSPSAVDDLMRQVEADALRPHAPTKPKQSKPAKPTQQRREAPVPPPIPLNHRPSWVVPAGLAAGCAIVASAAVFFLARWDAQQGLQRLDDQTVAMQRQFDSQQQRLDEQADRINAQLQQIRVQGEAMATQAELLQAQRDLLAAQGDRVGRVEFSVQAQQAMTEELRDLFTDHRNDMVVLMRQEEEARRVLSLLSAPRLEAYVLAGTPDAPDAAGRMFYDPATRRLRLTVAGLDTADPGRTYQAWFVLDDGAGAPVSLGTFNTNAAGDAVFETVLNQAPADIALAAVSVEPAGGVPAPTGAIVIAGGSQ